MKQFDKTQFTIGVVVLFAILFIGTTFLKSGDLIFRMLVGLGLGYALMRSAFGFAGSANRAYNTGSTKLLRTMMFMMFLTVIPVAAILYIGGAENYGLWVNQINLGLIVGGLLFGIGMAFSMCCASGVLTDMIEGPTRALITIIFFGIGVFLGFPLQATQGWINDTWFHSATFEKGVFLPDLLGFDGMNGYLAAIIVTGILALLVAMAAKWYENKRRKEGTFTGVGSEIEQDEAMKEMLTDETVYPVCSETAMYRFFAKPWSLKMGAVVIAIIFAALMIVTKSGWGASTPYGYWFGRILMAFGMPIETITAFTHQPDKPFIMPFFANPMNVQNISIILGALVASLTTGNFVKQFTAGLKISPKEIPVYIIGGLLMGLGTRFANGCNVGALYTPIANFSLSGWIYFIFLFSGGMLGNMIKKRYFNACDRCKK